MLNLNLSLMMQRAGGGAFEPMAGLSIELTRTSGPAPMGVSMKIAGLSDYQRRFWSFKFDLIEDYQFSAPPLGARIGSRSSRYTWGIPWVSHTYRTPGTYTPQCAVYNEAGVLLGTLTAPEITVTNPDTVFAGARTIYVDSTGAHPLSQTDWQEVTTISAALTAAATIATGGNQPRILLTRGQEYSSDAKLAVGSNSIGYYIGAIGTGARPILRADVTTGSSLRPSDGNPLGEVLAGVFVEPAGVEGVLSGIQILGEYDPANPKTYDGTDADTADWTAILAGVSYSIDSQCLRWTIDACIIKGFGQNLRLSTDNTYPLHLNTRGCNGTVVSDTVSTDWYDYGTFQGLQRDTGFRGCWFYQNPKAKNEPAWDNDKGGWSDARKVANIVGYPNTPRHGPFRFTYIEDFSATQCVMSSQNGWSPTSDDNPDDPDGLGGFYKYAEPQAAMRWGNGTFPNQRGGLTMCDLFSQGVVFFSASTDFGTNPEPTEAAWFIMDSTHLRAGVSSRGFFETTYTGWTLRNVMCEASEIFTRRVVRTATTLFSVGSGLTPAEDARGRDTYIINCGVDWRKARPDATIALSSMTAAFAAHGTFVFRNNFWGGNGTFMNDDRDETDFPEFNLEDVAPLSYRGEPLAGSAALTGGTAGIIAGLDKLGRPRTSTAIRGPYTQVGGNVAPAAVVTVQGPVVAGVLLQDIAAVVTVTAAGNPTVAATDFTLTYEVDGVLTAGAEAVAAGDVVEVIATASHATGSVVSTSEPQTVVAGWAFTGGQIDAAPSATIAAPVTDGQSVTEVA